MGFRVLQFRVRRRNIILTTKNKLRNTLPLNGVMEGTCGEKGTRKRQKERTE
jgi:hypothetical protein